MYSLKTLIDSAAILSIFEASLILFWKYLSLKNLNSLEYSLRYFFASIGVNCIMYTSGMNIIFDFDGTICDSFNLTLRIANEYLTKFKKKTIDVEDFRKRGIEELLKDYKLTKFQILVYVLKERRELTKHLSNLKTFPRVPKLIK